MKISYWIHFCGCFQQTLLANHSHTRTDNNTKPVNILIQDTGFNIGPNNVSSDIKVDSDEFPLQR